MAVAGGSSDEDGLGRWQPADLRFRPKSAFEGRCAVCTRIHLFLPAADKPAHKVAAARSPRSGSIQAQSRATADCKKGPRSCRSCDGYARPRARSSLHQAKPSRQEQTNKKDGSMRIMNAPLCTRVLVADPIETLQRMSRISPPQAVHPALSWRTV